MARRDLETAGNGQAATAADPGAFNLGDVDTSRVQFVGERRQDQLQFVGDGVKPDRKFYACTSRDSAELADQVRRRQSQGYRYYNPATDGDVQCVGLPASDATVYMVTSREIANRHEAGRRAAVDAHWAAVRASKPALDHLSTAGSGFAGSRYAPRTNVRTRVTQGVAGG